MRITLLAIISIIFISCQNKTPKINEDFYSNNKKIETPKEKIEYGYAVLIYEVPVVDYTEPVYNDFGMVEFGTGVCKVYYKKMLLLSDIIKYKNYMEDDSYELLDFLTKRYDILYKPDRNYMSLELRNCPDKEKYLNYTTKFIKKEFFIFDTYKDASIHKDTNFNKI